MKRNYLVKSFETDQLQQELNSIANEGWMLQSIIPIGSVHKLTGSLQVVYQCVFYIEIQIE